MKPDYDKTLMDVKPRLAAPEVHRFTCHCTTVYAVDVNLHACCLHCGRVFIGDEDDPNAGAVASLVDPRGPVLHGYCERSAAPEESERVTFAA